MTVVSDRDVVDCLFVNEKQSILTVSLQLIHSSRLWLLRYCRFDDWSCWWYHESWPFERRHKPRGDRGK
jgi:hypothetical protein